MSNDRVIVEVVWHDACSRVTGWTEGHKLGIESDQPLVVRSVGYLLRRSRRHVVLAMNTHDLKAADTMTIPAGCVKRVRRLGRG